MEPPYQALLVERQTQIWGLVAAPHHNLMCKLARFRDSIPARNRRPLTPSFSKDCAASQAAGVTRYSLIFWVDAAAVGRLANNTPFTRDISKHRQERRTPVRSAFGKELGILKARANDRALNANGTGRSRWCSSASIRSRWLTSSRQIPDSKVGSRGGSSSKILRPRKCFTYSKEGPPITISNSLRTLLERF
jgi:hypothetical protein